MEVNERDPVTGRETTGHEWNGIKELDTPVPRGVLMFLIVTHIWAIAWWFFVPAWPLGTTYTKGLLGVDQRTTVEEQIVEGPAGAFRLDGTPGIRTLRRDPGRRGADADRARHRATAVRRQLRRLSRPRRQGTGRISRT